MSFHDDKLLIYPVADLVQSAPWRSQARSASLRRHHRPLCSPVLRPSLPCCAQPPPLVRPANFTAHSLFYLLLPQPNRGASGGQTLPQSRAVQVHQRSLSNHSVRSGAHFSPAKMHKQHVAQGTVGGLHC